MLFGHVEPLKLSTDLRGDIKYEREMYYWSIIHREQSCKTACSGVFFFFLFVKKSKRSNVLDKGFDISSNKSLNKEKTIEVNNRRNLC